MKKISAASLHGWFDRAFDAKMDWRLNPYFFLTLNSVSWDGSKWLVQGTRTGERSADGNTYVSAIPGYTPSVGDVVQMVWAAKNVGYVFAPLQVKYVGGVPYNPYRCKVNRSGAWTSASANTAIIGFDVVEYDNNNNWDATHDWYAVPVAGDYLVILRLGIQGLNAINAQVWVNGVEKYGGTQHVSASPNWNESICTVLYPASVGDHIQGALFSQVATTGITGADRAFMQIQLVNAY